MLITNYMSSVRNSPPVKASLSGKTAVITGSTAGVGYAIAKGLALAGAKVVVNGRQAIAVDAAVAKLGADVAPGGVNGLAADVGTAEGCAALVAAHPSVDILVINAGIYGSQDFFEISDAEWTRYFEVNVMSGVRLARAYLPGMLQRYWGRVLFLSSEWALDIPVDMIHYGLTKSALLSVTHGLSKRVASTGVTVNAIMPGPILPSSEASAQQEPRELCLTMEETLAAFEAKHRLRSTLQHTATADEVAKLAVSLCSAQAAGTTGELLHVDGGLVETMA